MVSREKWSSKFKIKESSWVFVPTEETIKNGLKIKATIEQKWHPPKFFYHLAGGSHIRALRCHLENEYFIHLDIQDFFGNINRSKITRCLKEFISYNEARQIAVESTVCDPESLDRKFILPFGFVQSPIIASLCLDFSALGRCLESLSKSEDFTVSVYMDDIIVSSNSTDGLKEQIQIIEKVAGRSRFPLNSDKQEGPESQVTAFNILLSKNQLEITVARMEAFDKIYCASENEHQKEGIRSYIASVSLDQSAHYSE